MSEEDEVSNRVKGQNRFDCEAAGCEETGRALFRIGDMKIAYCGEHRKEGERVMNFLVDSVFRHKLTRFLKDSKHELFMQDEPTWCEDCQEKIKHFVKSKVDDLEDLEEFAEKNDV